MVPETQNWQAPALVLQRLPLLDCQVASPVAPTPRVRRDSSLPLPILLRRFGPLPCHQSLCQPLHFLRVRPTSIIQSFLHPSSFHDQPPHHIAVRVCPRFVGLTPQHSLDGLQPHSFFQLLTLVLCGPFLPTDHPGLFQKHLF